MFLRKKITKSSCQMISVLLTVMICGVFTMAAAQTDISGKAFKGSAELRKRQERTAKDIDKYADQLDKTTRSLTRLGQAKGDESRKRYENFSKELKELEKVQDRTVSSVDKMVASGVKYFSSWEKANASITDPELREVAARRHSREVTKHVAVAQALGDIGHQAQPLMSCMRDLRAFLAADLSPGNLRRASERIDACEAEAATLRYKIADVQRILKQFLGERPK